MPPDLIWAATSGGLLALGLICLWTGQSDTALTAGGVLSLALCLAILGWLSREPAIVVHVEAHARLTPEVAQ